jgi:hypothetical protein
MRCERNQRAALIWIPSVLDESRTSRDNGYPETEFQPVHEENQGLSSSMEENTLRELRIGAVFRLCPSRESFMREESSDFPSSGLIDVSGISLGELTQLDEAVIVSALREVLDPRAQTNEFVGGGFSARI